MKTLKSIIGLVSLSYIFTACVPEANLTQPIDTSNLYTVTGVPDGFDGDYIELYTWVSDKFDNEIQEISTPILNNGDIEIAIIDLEDGTVAHFEIHDRIGNNGHSNPSNIYMKCTLEFDTVSDKNNKPAIQCYDSGRKAFYAESSYRVIDLPNLGNGMPTEGVEAFDAICNQDAEDFFVEGTFLAQVSSATSHYKDRYGLDRTKPLHLTDVNDSLLFNNGFYGLVYGGSTNKITSTTGVVMPEDTLAWSSTNKDSEFNLERITLVTDIGGGDCGNYTVSDTAARINAGKVNGAAPNGGQIFYDETINTRSCTGAYRLLCVERK